MPSGNVSILFTLGAIGLVLFLILYARLHAFLALMIASLALGLSCGMGPAKVLKSIQAGFGDALGFIAVVLALGAMIGRFLEVSGGGRALADWLLERAGPERAVWAVLISAFLVGLPIFFRGGLHHPGAAGLEPGAGVEEIAALFRTADRLRVDRDTFDGSPSPGSGGRRATARRGPGTRDSAWGGAIDTDDDCGWHRLWDVDLQADVHRGPGTRRARDEGRRWTAASAGWRRATDAGASGAADCDSDSSGYDE